jgi:excinuclease ABC subunit C
VLTPIRGSKSELVQMAAQNAIQAMKEKFAVPTSISKDKLEILSDLSEILHVPSLHQIEMIDNSHLQGVDPVSGVIVFINGEPAKREYRKYKIKQENSKDDTSSMYEVIYRRYYRKLVEGGTYSNLIIVDGGITQIRAVMKALNELNIDIKVAGLVKDDHHRTKALLDSDNNEYLLNDNKSLLFFLTKMQDEVHRFAITFHHNVRTKSLTSSTLDGINGIGSKRKEALIKAFGSINKIKEASLQELEQFIPTNVALNLKEKLDNQ